MLFKITREEALKFDLLVCSCGHRPNNHFDFESKSCAHCDCKKYAEKPRVGKIVKNKKVKQDYSWFSGKVDVELIKAIIESKKDEK